MPARRQRKYEEQAETPRDTPRKYRIPTLEVVRDSARVYRPPPVTPRQVIPPQHDKSSQLQGPVSPASSISFLRSPSTVNHPPALGMNGSMCQSTIERSLSLDLSQYLSMATSYGDNSTLFHPPVGNEPERSVGNELERSLSPAMIFSPSSGFNSTVYHPPDSNETDSEAEFAVDRYMAAIENHLQHQKYSQSQSISLEISDTDTDNHSTGSSTFGTNASDLTSGTTDRRSTNHLSKHSRFPKAFSPFSKDSDVTNENLLVDDDFLQVEQRFGYCSIGISAIQLLVLMLQLTLCGVAPLDVNRMVGPYPDTFSEWGGKNAYLLLKGQEYWRFVTPAFLHVGVLHLLCNAMVQLQTCAFFEREWGSKRWLLIYSLSEVGCVVVSCVWNPDTLAVGSSGAVMGLFGAKFAQLIANTVFELVLSNDSHIRMEQFSGVLCSLSIISILSALTYIDWSGHVGGFATGFCVGMVAISTPIRNSAIRFLWNIMGLGLLGAGAYYAFRALFTTTEPDEDLGNPCEYFRALFAEDYKCECLWQ